MYSFLISMDLASSSGSQTLEGSDFFPVSLLKRFMIVSMVIPPSIYSITELVNIAEVETEKKGRAWRPIFRLITCRSS